jgi:hypothetical protein
MIDWSNFLAGLRVADFTCIGRPHVKIEKDNPKDSPKIVFDDPAKFAKDIGPDAAIGLEKFEANKVTIDKKDGKRRVEFESERKEPKSINAVDGSELTFDPKFRFEPTAKDKDGKELTKPEEIEDKAVVVDLHKLEGFSFKDKDGKPVEVSSVQIKPNDAFGSDMVVIDPKGKEHTVWIPDGGTTFRAFKEFVEAGVSPK